MAAVMSIALVMFAQAAAATPTSSGTALPQQASTPSGSSSDSCPAPSSDGRTIVICTERPKGYRLNPDVMEAKREMKNPGRPVRPGGTVRPDCATVGPWPCVQAGINLLGAVATAAEMAKRAASGQEIGSMFKTDPQLTEYQRYQMAKARRETEQAEKDQEAAVAKMKAEDAAAAKAREAQPAQQSAPAPANDTASKPSGN